MLKASGSSLFLKKRFGLGYNLSLVISPERRHGQAQNKLATRKLRIRRVTELVQDKIPEVELVRTTSFELVLRVPRGCEARLPITLAMLDLQSRRLGIGSVGIEDSSLEEVVNYLSEGPSMGDEFPHDITTTVSLCDDSSCSTSIHGGVVVEPSPSTFLENHQTKNLGNHGTKSLAWIEQVKLFYWKRFVIQKRNLKGLLFIVLVPTLVVALIFLILTVDVSLAGPAIEMSPLALGIKTTDVVVGGGAAFRHRLTAKRDIAQQVDSLSAGVRRLYQNTVLHHLADMRSSWNLSDYLLGSHANYGGNNRYGGFVLKDVLTLKVGVDWAFYESDFELILNNALRIFDDFSIDPATANEFIGLGVDMDFTAIVSNTSKLDDAPFFLVICSLTLCSLFSFQNFLFHLLQQNITLFPFMTEFLFRQIRYPTSQQDYSFTFDTAVSILHNTSSSHAA